MSRRRLHPLALAAPLVAAGLLALYRAPLRLAFLNDDFLFLEEARTRPLLESLGRLGALGNFYRPLSRQIYFEALAPILGGSPAVFHAVNFTLFLGALVLLADLLLVLAPPLAALAGVLWFATLPLQRVNLSWISCSQDLMALAGALGCLALWRRGRTGLATLVALLAMASKESALPIAAGVVAWDVAIAGRPLGAALRRARPLLLVTVLWAALALTMSLGRPGSGAFVRFDPVQFLAAFAHLAQSLVGLDHPPGFYARLFRTGPDPFALALIAAAAIGFVAARRRPEEEAADARAAIDSGPPHPPAPRRIAAFAVVWTLGFTLVTGPVAHSWSSYYYTLAAAGGAALVALAARPLGAGGWVALAAGLLWWHAAGTSARAFAVADRPWVWTSHLTSGYFERAAAITDTLSRQLRRIEPAPPANTRFFFAELSSYAGFQMGNGALIRALYRDPSLESHFYSRFSDSTADGYPFRLLYWDGRALAPLYPESVTRDPLFQVGTDLLMLDQPRRAAFAFRRGLAEGGNPNDHLYWLGWAELWSGNRGAAEAAWAAWGARDDSAAWRAKLAEAQALWAERRDALAVQRLLLEAVVHGIGRPEAHAQLGRVIVPTRPKYGLLELKVAVALDPGDHATRLWLAQGLAEVNLDEPARRELERLERVPAGELPESTLGALRRRLGRSPAPPVVTY